MTGFSALPSVILVTDLAFAPRLRGRWALVSAPDGCESTVAEELETEWSFAEPAATIVRMELDGAAQPLLDRCRAGSDEVFVVVLRGGLGSLAKQLDAARSRWLESRGGIFIVRESEASEFANTAINSTSAMLGRCVRWAPDPANTEGEAHP